MCGTVPLVSLLRSLLWTASIQSTDMPSKPTGSYALKVRNTVGMAHIELDLVVYNYNHGFIMNESV